MAKSKTSRVSRELSFRMEAVDGTVNAGQNEIFKITSPASMQDRVGMLIHKIEYHFDYVPLSTWLGAGEDCLRFGLSFLAQQPAQGFTAISGGVIDYNAITRVDFGTAANAKIYTDPFVRKDMHLRHPDGVLIHPASLYWWYYVHNTIADAFCIDCKVWYEDMTISDSDWDDLWKQIFVTQAG